ncbi:MAG: hypothetical protein CBE00_09900 [Planctomycetaceae bacterium TMED240]|nr:hypothetical protein [Rhodopirellula sp.]OUX05542.1 MAG: hypothetical protein CBE00_09900 [Planctomycetaceae bacterium TMED240]
MSGPTAQEPVSERVAWADVSVTSLSRSVSGLSISGAVRMHSPEQHVGWCSKAGHGVRNRAEIEAMLIHNEVTLVFIQQFYC